jgi:tRNA threonylcarbamoyl adenosine modification protein YeaZ
MSRQQVWPLGRDISSHLHVCLAEFLPPQEWSDLSFIAVASGPGGFTGTRLGVVTARVLAQQLEIPLFAVSTLAAIAWQSQPTGTIAVQMPAQRGDLFGAIYQTSPQGLEILLPDTVLPAPAWQQKLESLTDSCQRIAATGGLGSNAASVLELAWLEWLQGKRPHWSIALPFYGQHPVAASQP